MNKSTQNDTTGLTLNQVIINSGGYGISGNTVNVMAGLFFNFGGPGTGIVSAPVTATSNITIEADAGSFASIAGNISGSSFNIDFHEVGSLFVSGVISGSGIIGKSGSGILTIQTAPTSTGPIDADEGKLDADAAISEPVNLDGTAVLDGTGPFSNDISVSGHSAIRPFGPTIPNYWTVGGNLVFNGGGAMVSDVASNGIVFGRANVSGNVDLTGAALLVNFSMMPSVGASIEVLSTPTGLNKCFSAVYSNMPTVEVRGECTANSASALVVCTDDIKNDSFDDCPVNVQACGWACQNTGTCQ